jgi:hypothetical protein
LIIPVFCVLNNIIPEKQADDCGLEALFCCAGFFSAKPAMPMPNRTLYVTGQAILPA